MVAARQVEIERGEAGVEDATWWPVLDRTQCVGADNPVLFTEERSFSPSRT
jgi:hypothetical protein